MLNIFPSFLDFALLAPFIIRVVIGAMFFRFGIKKVSKKNTKVCVGHFASLGINNTKIIYLVGILEILGSISLVLGLYTQISALVLGLLSLATYLLMKKKKATLSHSDDFYFLLFIMNLSLFLTGAGAYAFDLPL